MIELIRKINVSVNAQSENLVVRASTGAHKIILDESEVYGGQNKGPHPMETLLATLASGTNITANMIAAEMYFDLRGLTFDVYGVFDPFGVMGDATVHPFYEQVTVNVEVDTTEDDAEIQALKRQVEARCPIYTLFKAAGVKMNDTWVKA